MSRFWIDYSTSVLIEAETAEEAEELFWSGDYEALGYAEIGLIGIEEEKD